jgi:hypothetical protein
MRRLLGLLVVGALGALGAGCGGNHCSDAVDCEGGNETDKEACEIEVEALYEQAEIDGCTDLVDAWIDCMTDGASCQKAGNGNRWGSRACDGEELKARECVEGDGAAF